MKEERKFKIEIKDDLLLIWVERKEEYKEEGNLKSLVIEVNVFFKTNKEGDVDILDYLW